MRPEFGPAWRDEWPLDPAITYLNHGTVGVVPRRILAEAARLREEIEAQPARFLLRELADSSGAGLAGVPERSRTRLRQAADVVAPFLGLSGDELAFVENATSGANAVLRSYPLAPGDEILTTDLGYGGVTNVARFAARQAGGTHRILAMPRPGAPAEQFVDAVRAGLGDATRILVIDHIAAEMALVLPIAEIAAVCHDRDVLVLVDGAHAPGAIPLDIDASGADWYIGNLHKWAWTPRSAGVLWAAPSVRPHLHAHVVSWGLDNGLSAEFDMLGTRDPTPYLVAPAALAMMQEIGVEAVQGYDHELAWWAGRYLSDRWDTPFGTPESMVGTMVTVRLPERAGSTREDAWQMQTSLLYRDGIELPVCAVDGRLWTRVSAQIYNDRTDIERLGEAVLSRLARREAPR